MLRLKAHKGDVFGVTASPAHGKIASAGHDTNVYIWDPSRTGHSTEQTSLAQLVHKHRIAHDHIISCLETYCGPASEHAVLISGSWDGLIRLWDFNYQKGTVTAPAHFAPSVTDTASASTDTNTVGDISERDSDGNKAPKRRNGLLHTLDGHTHRVKALCALSLHLPSDVPRLVSGADDNSVRVWNISNGECILALQGLHAGFINDIAVAPTRQCSYMESYLGKSDQKEKGKMFISAEDTFDCGCDFPLLASCGVGGELRLLNLVDGQLICHPTDATASTTTSSSHVSDMTSVLFCFNVESNQRMLCCGNSKGDIDIWAIKEATASSSLETVPLFSIHAHMSAVTALVQSSTSTLPLLLSIGVDGFLRSWSVNAALGETRTGSIILDCSKVFADSNTKRGVNDTHDRERLLCVATMMKSRSTSDSAATAEFPQEGVTMRTEDVIVGGTNGLLLVITLTTLVPIGSHMSDTDILNGNADVVGARSASASPVAVERIYSGGEEVLRLPSILLSPTVEVPAGRLPADNVTTSASGTQKKSTLPPVTGATQIVGVLSASSGSAITADLSVQDVPKKFGMPIEMRGMKDSSSEAAVACLSPRLTSASKDRGKHTLLESLQMEGELDAFSLGYGVAGTWELQNEKPAATAAREAIDINFSVGVGTAPLGGHRGILLSRRTAGPPKPREIKQATSMPAYCLVEPTRQKSIEYQAAAAAALVESYARTKRQPIAVAGRRARTGGATYEMLLANVNSTYGGTASDVSIASTKKR